MSTSDLGQRIAAAQARATGKDGGSMMSGASSAAKPSGSGAPAIANALTFFAWLNIGAGVILFFAFMGRGRYGEGWAVSVESIGFLLTCIAAGCVLFGFAKVIALLSEIAQNTRPAQQHTSEG